jgi:hypothetical protein
MWQPIEYAPWKCEVLVYDQSPDPDEPTVFTATYLSDEMWPRWEAAPEFDQVLDPSDIDPTHYYPGWRRGDPLPDPPDTAP